MTSDPLVVETRTAKLWLDEDGILRTVMTPGAEEGIEEAKRNTEAAECIAAGRKLPVLIDMRALKFATREAREYYAGEGPTRYSLAQALLVRSPVSRVIGQFFIGSRLSKPSFPTRLFHSESEALAWLRQFLPGGALHELE